MSLQQTEEDLLMKQEKKKKLSKREVVASWRKEMEQKEFEIIQFLKSLGFSCQELERKNQEHLYRLTGDIDLLLIVQVDRVVAISWQILFSDSRSDKHNDLLEELEIRLRKILVENVKLSGTRTGLNPKDLDIYEIKVNIARATIFYERAKSSLIRISDSLSKTIDLCVETAIKKISN